jgi:plastocyanin domain-containing protein
MIRMALIAATALFAGRVLAAETASPTQGKKVEIKVTEDGFKPKKVKAKKGEPITLVFTRTTESTCITAVDIPDEDVKDLELPLNEPVSVTVTPKKAGVEKFHCSAMAMGDGRLVVSE